MLWAVGYGGPEGEIFNMSRPWDVSVFQCCTIFLKVLKGLDSISRSNQTTEKGPFHPEGGWSEDGREGQRGRGQAFSHKLNFLGLLFPFLIIICFNNPALPPLCFVLPEK